MQNELPARPLLWRGVPVEYGENEVKSARVFPVRSRWVRPLVTHTILHRPFSIAYLQSLVAPYWREPGSLTVETFSFSMERIAK